MTEITVTHGDKYAAAEYLAELGQFHRPDCLPDRHVLVQAFAKHRQSSTEEVEQLRKALGEFVDSARVGKGDKPVTKSRYVHAPATVFHKACVVLRRTALTGASTHD